MKVNKPIADFSIKNILLVVTVFFACLLLAWFFVANFKQTIFEIYI
jgi:DNA-binding transcriptional regulator of glucitol operon